MIILKADADVHRQLDSPLHGILLTPNILSHFLINSVFSNLTFIQDILIFVSILTVSLFPLGKIFGGI